MNQLNELKQWLREEVLASIQKPGKLVEICAQPIGNTETYMLTNCYKVKLVYVNENVEDTCFLVVKKTLKLSTEYYDAINFDSLFRNEIEAYTRIIPTLQRFTKTEMKDLVFPKYYYSKLLRDEASIVLGDFSADGWRMTKSRINLSLEHIILAVQQIAMFHGLCYALKATERDNFDDLIGRIKQSRYGREPPAQWITIVTASVQRLKRAVHKFCPQIPSDFLGKLEKLLSQHFIFGKRRFQPIEPYATLCHGDFLRNNIAYKYSDEDPDRPTGAMMFDFQTLSYTSPMVDVCVFLSLSAGKDVRPMHFNEIFDAYHHKLTSTFANHAAMDVPGFLSKSELLKEYVRYLPYGLWIASYFLLSLHDPSALSPEEVVASNTTKEMLIMNTMDRGGEAVDAEIAAIAKELYDLTVQENVDVFENLI